MLMLKSQFVCFYIIFLVENDILIGSLSFSLYSKYLVSFGLTLSWCFAYVWSIQWTSYFLPLIIFSSWVLLEFHLWYCNPASWNVELDIALSWDTSATVHSPVTISSTWRFSWSLQSTLYDHGICPSWVLIALWLHHLARRMIGTTLRLG